MNILLSNDDGIYAHGLRALYTACREAGHTVYVVAPMTEQSATGHSLSIFTPLRTKEIYEKDFSGLGVYGTPIDCIKLALLEVLPQRPDVVIAGINAGPNVGPDILCSGTVAAATEGAHAGLRAMALSYDYSRPPQLLEQAQHAVGLLAALPWDNVPARCVINVNYPHLPMKDTLPLRLCPQTSALWHDSYQERHDPRGHRYWWLEGKMCEEDVEVGTDRALLTQGHITLTPLHFDFTHRECLASLTQTFL